MKNRIASLFLAFALLLSLCNFAAARDNLITVRSGGAERFTDVPTDHWAYAYINKVVGSGLFNGKTETTFEPSNAMTRSQFVLVMDRMEGMSSLEGIPTQTIFPDVAPTRRAAGPIQWANEQGFVLGFGDGTFKPDSPITRGQFAALIHRYIVAKKYTKLHVVDPEPAQFTDAGSVSNAFKDDVEYARVHGLLTGYSDGTVRASNPITRAAIAAILARFLDLVSESGYTPLLDAKDGGDSGDSGNQPVEAPSSYKDIKLNVSGGSHGSTSIASALRNGVQVASDDLKPGDIVTINHTPESGYTASVRVRDAKGKTVKVTTNGNVSTFVAPDNLPVTVTVTYTRISSGGGGGGGGGGATASYYYLDVKAAKTGAAEAESNVWLSLNNIADKDAYDKVAEGNKVTTLYDRHSSSEPSFTFYAVLEYDKGVTAAIASPASGVTDEAQEFEIGENRFARVVTITMNGSTSRVTTSIIAQFNKTGDVQQDKVTWTVNANIPNAEVRFYGAQPDAEKFGNDGLVNWDDFKNVDPGEKTVYVAIKPNDGFTFDGAELKADDDAEITLSYESNTPLFRVYEVTKTVNETATTTLSMTLQGQVTWTVSANIPNAAYGFYDTLEEAKAANPTGTDNVGTVKPVNTGNNTVYFVVAPNEGYDFADAVLTDGVTIFSVVDPDAASSTNKDAKRVYEITKNITQNTTTNLSMRLHLTDADKHTWVVSVKSYLMDGDTPKDFGDKAFSSPTPKQEMGQPVTINAPIMDVKGGYDIDHITVKQIASKSGDEESDIDWSKATETKTTDISLTPAVSAKVTEYTFTMPDQNVLVEVYYKTIANPELSYKVNVYIDGEGSVPLNIAGMSKTVSSNADAKDGDPDATLEVKLLDGKLSLVDDASGDAVKESDYDASYPDRTDYKLPVYLGGALVPGENYKIKTEPDNVTKDEQFVLENGTDLDINVAFAKIQSYGYNLTIIGQGAVDATLSGTATVPYRNTGATPQTFSVGPLDMDEAPTLTISAPKTVSGTAFTKATEGKYNGMYVNGTATVAEKLRVTNASAADYTEAITLRDGLTANIVVEFHDQDRSAVPFTVKVVGDGSVNVKPESGLIATGASAEAATTNLENGAGADSYTVDKDTSALTYYAYSGTIITVTPSGSKVYSVKVKNGSTDLSDVMNTTGYSFQLPKNTTPNTEVVVTFGKYDADNAFRALLLTPYGDKSRIGTDTASDAGLLSESTTIKESNTVLDVLYSLNDGENSDTLKANGNGITNKFKTAPRTLNTTLSAYMTEKYGKDDNGNPQSGADALADMLKSSVEAQLKTMIPKVIDEALKDNSSAKESMSAEIAKAQKDIDNLTVTGAAKNVIVQQLKQLEVTVSGAKIKPYAEAEDTDFAITAKVTPILTEAKAQELGAEGRSVEAKLNSLIEDYFTKSNLQVDYHWGANDDNYTADVTADASASTTTSTVINVSAELKSNDGNWPEFTPVVKMSSYADTLKESILIAAQITKIDYLKGDDPDVSSLPVTLYSASQFDLGADDPTSALTDSLNAVDNTVSAAIKDRLDGKKIDMSQVLDQTMIQGILREAIAGPMETIVGNPETGKKAKIASLGDGEATKSAFLHIADQLVLVNNGPTLVLQKKGGSTVTVGEVKDNALVLTLNFEDILRDASDDTADNTVYEQLADLIVGIRNGVSADIQTNPEIAKDKKTAKSVIAGMLEPRMNKATATKWGTVIGKGGERAMTSAEKKELANLLAGLVMDSALTGSNLTKMSDAWKDFEASGYRAVEFRLTKTFSDDAAAAPFVKSLNSALNLGKDNTELSAGFLLEQNITPAQ